MNEKTTKSLSQDERIRCVRALLSQPLITARGSRADDFRSIRRQAAWLREWFVQQAGWNLTVENDFARLSKFPDHYPDGSRPAYDTRKHIPFTRQRYVMLCLILAVLERSERQTVLGRIAQEMLRIAHSDDEITNAGIKFDMEERECRMDLVAVVRTLIEWGVLDRIHGNEDAFIQTSEDVLYTIRRPILANLICVQRGPSTVIDTEFAMRLQRIQTESMPESDEGRRRRLRTTLVRMLLDNPVVYYADLSEEERTYLHSQRSRLLTELENATGLVSEIREEGIALVDPEQELTDHPMPEEGTRGHAALLIAEYLANALRAAKTAVTMVELEGQIKSLAREHRAHWRKGVSESGGELVLLREVLDIFEALSLIRRTRDQVTPLPAISRYRLKEVRLENFTESESLFER